MIQEQRAKESKHAPAGLSCLPPRLPAQLDRCSRGSVTKPLDAAPRSLFPGWVACPGAGSQPLSPVGTHTALVAGVLHAEVDSPPSPRASANPHHLPAPRSLPAPSSVAGKPAALQQPRWASPTTSRGSATALRPDPQPSLLSGCQQQDNTREAVESPSLEIFKTRLDKILCSLL